MMRSRNGFVSFVFIAIAFLILSSLSVWAADRKMDPNELVAKHLDSIGTAEARATLRSREAQGNVAFEEMIGHGFRQQGGASFSTQGATVKYVFQFGAPQYVGEQLAFDGKKVTVANIDPTKRSNLGNYLYQQDEIMRAGLFGGTLSTAWPLLRLKESGAGIKYVGLIKVEGRELHDLIFTPKKRSGAGDLVIHLYFDPATFRHVGSLYLLRVAGSSGLGMSGEETRQILEERFDDFQEIDGLTIPQKWEIRFHMEPQAKARVFQWMVIWPAMRNNPN